ncbi:hypothetical protein BGX33_003415 [Mortierella sp. NVP41]|nr:hypothetical protein BGX33_003415 [Mortierella sp. NVP41]
MVSLWRPSIDNQDGGSNAMLTPRRENPLTKLVSLGMWNVESSIPTSEILSVIKHCPNVKELTLPNLASCSDVDVIWAFIGQHCPSLRLLNCTLGRVSLSVIFKECSNLDVLRIKCGTDEGLYLHLTDATEFPWAFTKLSKLSLSISGCELLTDDPEHQPYYSRPSRISLSEPEKQHFARLEGLYRQIGELTELQFLDLKMATIQQGQDQSDESKSFPAMLSLGDTWTGRQGYLRHLSGLKNLEVLAGSVSVDTEEAKVTMGCLDEFFPRLRFAEFFKDNKDVRAPFEWLQSQRQHGRG